MTAIATIAGITFRQLVSRRRTILMLLLGAVLVVVALAFRLGSDASSPSDALSWTVGLLEYLGIAALVPLIALIMGTSAIGNELEDGTAVHLLTKPVARWQVGVAKLLVAIPIAAVLSGVPILLAGLIAAEAPSAGFGYAIGAVIGSAIYVTMFMALSLVTSRAFVIGLGYVLIWEGLLSGLFKGIATLSVRQYAISVARSITDGLGNLTLGADARLALGTAVVAAIVVSVVALAVLLRRLSRLEIAGETG